MSAHAEFEPQIVTTSTTFIRVTEIWKPCEDKGGLVVEDGCYGGLEELKQITSEIVFPMGSGLPGLAWKDRAPKILKTFEGSVFARTDLAQSVGMTSAVALPIFCEDEIQGVILFLCGDSSSLSGGIEVWSGDELGVLNHSDGYYGDLDTFESLSRKMQFPKGVGLPGTVWKNECPLLISDVSKDSSSFLRAKYAEEAGITAGVGIPFFQGESLNMVLTFLSSKSTPIAERFEIWKPNESEDMIEFEEAIENGVSKNEPAGEKRSLEKGSQTIGKVWETGVPMLGKGELSDSYQSILAIPVIKGSKVKSIVVCYN